MKPMKAKVFKKAAKRDIRLAKSLCASEAIGRLVPNQDIYCLTFGQFSLVDALVHILQQTGPARVDLSTWTAADAHLQKTADLITSAHITRFRMVIDRSFEGRQPGYCQNMRRKFGMDCIRSVRTHAKFFLVRNERWTVVARTSMNLNENPRLENIEISTDDRFGDFMESVVDEIFSEVDAGVNRSKELKLESLEQASPYRLVDAISLDEFKTISVTHELTK
jgi:hypothetical protein